MLSFGEDMVRLTNEGRRFYTQRWNDQANAYDSIVFRTLLMTLHALR